MKRTFFRLAVVGIFALSAMSLRAVEERPNIVFILADDLGWLDVGYNGNTFYETPNIDRLAAGGMTFNRAYSGGPNCSPTRACIISGMYGPRTNVWTPGAQAKGDFKRMKLLVPNRNNTRGNTFESVESLVPEVVSLAEILMPAGYATARFGKWHLGADPQGFDISFHTGDADYKPESKGYSDTRNPITITDAGIRFIEQNASASSAQGKDRPFFLYLAHFEVHAPLKAEKAVVEKYKSKLASKEWREKWNPTYAAMFEAVDNSVGRILEKLDELGLSENTLVIFSSDNGAVAGVTPILPLRGAKGSFYEGGVRVPTCMRWPGTIAAGSACDTPITSVDFMPTFAELAGAELPKNQPVDGASFVPLLKGDNIPERSIFWHYPLYLEGNNAQDRVVPIAGTKKGYWRATPSSVICRGDWKLIHYLEESRVELYNLAEDPSEKSNLAEKQPEKAATLLQELNEWRSATEAPMPSELNPDFTLR